jgi:hypothetical protein
MCLEIEVEKSQLEVETSTSETRRRQVEDTRMLQLWRHCVLCSSCEQGNSSRGRKAFRGLKNVWHDLWDYLKKTKGNWRQVNLHNEFDHSGELTRLCCRLAELPKIHSVVGCKNLQKSGRHSEV